MGSLNGEVLNFTSDNPQKFTELKVRFSPKQEGTGDPSPTNIRPITGYSSIDVYLNDTQNETDAAKYTIEFPEEAGAVYGGYVDFVNSELVVEYGIVDLSTVGFRQYAATNHCWSYNNVPSMIYGNELDEGTFYCDSYKTYGQQSILANGWDLGIWGYNTAQRKVIIRNDAYINEEGEYDIDAFRESLQGKMMCFPLAEPIHYPLNIYKTYRTLLGTNVVWTNGDTIEAEVKDYPHGTTAKTETGSVLNFNTYQQKQLTETKISFTPKQSGSGTPSPENVREIVGKNGITVWQSGKNLCPETTDTDYWSINGWFDNTGTIKPNGAYCMCDYRRAKPNTDYSFSSKISGWKGIGFYDTDFNPIGYLQRTSVSITLTSPSNAEYYRIYCRYNLSNLQLEIGSTPTEYEAYAPVETSVSFDDAPQDIDPSEVASTIYGGYVDISKGELVAEWTKVDMGDLNWGKAKGAFYINASDHIIEGSVGTPCEVICDIYPSGLNRSQSDVAPVDKNIQGAAGYRNIFIRDDDYATAADFKTAVAGHYLAYKLAEPIHYPLSPRILTTLQGANVMWSDGDSLTISYTDDVVNTYDFRRHISLDTPHKASASGAVASFGTDMVGKMKCKIHFSPKQEGSGTPSPENVRNISGRSSVKLWQSSENLIDITASVGEWPDLINGKRLYTPYKTYVGVHYSSDNYHGNSVSYEQVGNGFQFTSSNPSYGIGITFCVPQNAKIIANISSENAKLENIQCYDREWNFLKTIRNAQNTYQTTPSNACYGKAVFVPKTANILSIVTDFTLVIGTEIPEHLPPRTGNETTFTFPSTVGDNGVVYGGYLDTEKGEVVEEWYSVPTSAWTTYKQNNGYICYRTGGSPGTISGGTWFSNVISEYGSFSSSAMNKNIIQKNGSSNGGTIYMALDENVDISTVQVVYPISTPIHYSLTPQSIATLRGSNRLWSDGDSVEVEYYKHTDEPQEYIPAEVLGTGNIAIVTSDGYLIGEGQDYIKY